jgi:hypothetical protein
LTFRDNDDDEQPDHRDSAEGRQPDSRGKAIEYGKLFLHHIEPERRQLERWVSTYSRSDPVRYWLEYDHDLLFRINEIRKHMDVLLPALSPDLDGKPDPIRKLALAAQETWAEANNGRAPSPKNANGPLCSFLHKALEAIGMHYTEGYLCDVLKGYRRRGRGGRFA